MSDLRPVVFELLAAFSYLQSKNLIPPEIDLSEVVEHARKALTIELMIETDKAAVPTEVIVQVPLPASNLDIPEFKICANCGNRSDKIVHLKRRPPMLECQACGYTYKWPHRWG